MRNMFAFIIFTFIFWEGREDASQLRHVAGRTTNKHSIEYLAGASAPNRISVISVHRHHQYVVAANP